jgi:hypothetical protein
MMNKAVRKRSRRFKKLTGKLYAERVRLDRQGYDSHGRYWGVGQKLYRVSNSDTTNDPYIDKFVRAPSADTAKTEVYEQVFGKDT